MGKKDEPTILIDTNFTLYSLKMMKFIQECVQLANKLHAVAGRISLKFIMNRYDHMAEFMWDGVAFVRLNTSQIYEYEGPEKVMQFYQCLSEKTICANYGGHALVMKMWEAVFKPNLELVIDQKIARLSDLKGRINRADDPELQDIRFSA